MKKILLLALLVGLATPAVAQVNAALPETPGFVGGNINGKAVTAASSTSTLPANTTAYFMVTVNNWGTKDAFFSFGASAAVTDIPVRTGKSTRVLIPLGATQMSFICGGTDTTTLDIVQSNGNTN